MKRLPREKEFYVLSFHSDSSLRFTSKRFGLYPDSLNIMQIMKNGGQIKQCKNCGKYFVLSDKRKGEYCERHCKKRKQHLQPEKNYELNYSSTAH